jgi:hypothetical protein
MIDASSGGTCKIKRRIMRFVAGFGFLTRASKLGIIFPGEAVSAWVKNLFSTGA